ncbi:secretin N-terminal domain-containing protein [Litchfieldella rifensis]|uniref:Secretin N-terminal domain-containing protein n=1 Tax=Litchfieldella rifensis TaxID=762643 RepID=A0ABV7LKX3_9GAMM
MPCSPASLLRILLLSLVASPAWAMPVELIDADIRDFVSWYSDQTGQPLAVAPSVEGELTVYAPDVTPEQLPEFFEGVLHSHGYTIMPGNPSTVVVGSPEDFVDAIAKLPVEPLSTTLLAFANIRASDMVPVVSAYLSSLSPGAVVPQVLPAANALLVTGTDAQLADLAQLLPQFDVAHPQVLIKAVMYETSEGDTFDLGVALGRAHSGTDLAGGFNTNMLGRSLSVAGGSFGIFDGDVLALAVQALRRDSSATVLSTPQVITLSGQRGRISVGQNVPFITGRVTGQAADIENPFQTIERQDVGVSLEVSPVVTASGLVIMDVLTQADSLSSSVEASDVITNQRSITTTVQILSGQTVLLGGLVSEDVTETVSSVPGLGSLPLVGGLFRSTSTSTEKRNLNVLLQATVLPTIGEAS